MHDDANNPLLPRVEPIDYATPRPRAAAAAGETRYFDRKVAITLIVCGTLVMVAPWLLAIVAVLRGGEVTGTFWQVPFVWFSFLGGGLFVLIAIIKAPRSP